MARRKSSARSTTAVRPKVSDPPVARWEWVAVAALVLLAAGLRFAFPGRMAIEHFDEGVYASNIFFTAEEGGQYPYRHLYAPPLLPFLIEWGIIFLGPESIAPFLPALMLGTATVPLAWWAARCWFGPASGIAAGLLVATSDFHLLYSRTALTDVPVAFFIVLAVYLYWESIRRESVRWAIAAGVATGLAWWTKYTGWLPLAIAASGSAAWVLFERRPPGVSLPVRALHVTKLFAVTAVTAFVVWSPVLWGLQEYGGYAAVAENHRGYLRPIAEWPQTLVKQAAYLAMQSGGPTTVGLMWFAAIPPLVSLWPMWVRVLLSFWCAGTIGWVVFMLGPAFALAVLALAGLVVELVSLILGDRNPETSRPLSSERTLAAWLLLAWFVGMFLTTPLYYPYSRLAMPWVMAATFGAAVWVGSASRPFPRGLHCQNIFPAVLLALPIGMFVERFPAGGTLTAGIRIPGWEDRTGLMKAVAKAAMAIEKDHSKNEATIVYTHDTLSGPATFFNVAAKMGPAGAIVRPSGGLSVVERPEISFPVYVVTSDRDVIAWTRSLSQDALVRTSRHGRSVADNLFTFPSTLLELDAGDPFLDNAASLEVLRVEP